MTISINFISSKDINEDRVTHSDSDNIKFTSYNDANQFVNELFESLRSKYQNNLETCDFIFDSVQLIITTAIN